MSFALDLKKFAEKAGARQHAVVGELVTNIVATVDDRSPVGDAKYWKTPPPAGYVGGRFRGNWQLAIGSLPGGVVNRIDPDGRETVSANLGEIPDNAAGHVYFLANNLPYSIRLEHGWSRQAPQGIVGRTVTEFQAKVDNAVAAAKRRVP